VAKTRCRARSRRGELGEEIGDGPGLDPVRLDPVHPGAALYCSSPLAAGVEVHGVASSIGVRGVKPPKESTPVVGERSQTFSAEKFATHQPRTYVLVRV